MLIDLHADTPLWMTHTGYDFCRAHRPPLPAGAWGYNLDLPRLQAVGMDAQIFGLVSLPHQYDGFAVIQKMIARLRQAAARSAGAFCVVRSFAALQAARRQGATAGFLSLEGVHALRGQLARADALIEAGVLSFGLAHFHRNEACSPSAGLHAAAGAGLTTFGRALVAHLQARRCIVDLTHINRRGFFETLAAAKTASVMVSHTGVSAAYAHWRNLDDAQVRAIAQRGGIIGTIFSRHFLGGNDVDAVVSHIVHTIRLGGLEVAALGSDFDGFIVPVRGLRDVTGLPALAGALSRAGLSAAAVEAVMGGNAARFLRQATQ